MRAHLYGELAQHRRRAADDHVAGLYGADTFRRAGIDEIARIERVERRGEFDQAAAIVNQLVGVAVLPDLAVDGEADRYVVGVRDLVGGHHPGAERGVAVDRLAETAVLAAAHRHVEAEAIADDMVERARLRNVAAGL